MKFKTKDLVQSLTEPGNAIAYKITVWLARAYPERALEYSDELGVESYAFNGHCKLRVSSRPIPQYELGYNDADHPIYRTAKQAWFEVDWEGHSISVLQVSYNDGGYCSRRHYWMLGSSHELLQDFYKKVMDYNREIRDEILVFNGGSFEKDKQLYKDIQGSQLDNLVLPGQLKSELTQDFEQFFASEALYRQHGVPWKRGYLLIGPPGNGKSHTIKALVNHLGKPCIYVQSFKSPHYTDHHVMKTLFERARRTTPCIVILEDLDSLLNDGNRSFFLNELDGFAANHGILTLASTNHPERLDPAILERPSRFDRKYTFALPALDERKSYLKLWNVRLDSDMQLSSRGLHKVAQASDGFSYAYVKELVLSSMMAWIANPRPMDQVMLEVAIPLKSQLRIPHEVRAVYGTEDE